MMIVNPWYFPSRTEESQLSHGKQFAPIMAEAMTMCKFETFQQQTNKVAIVHQHRVGTLRIVLTLHTEWENKEEREREREIDVSG